MSQLQSYHIFFISGKNPPGNFLIHGDGSPEERGELSSRIVRKSAHPAMESKFAKIARTGAIPEKTRGRSSRFASNSSAACTIRSGVFRSSPRRKRLGRTVPVLTYRKDSLSSFVCSKIGKNNRPLDIKQCFL